MKRALLSSGVAGLHATDEAAREESNPMEYELKNMLDAIYDRASSDDDVSDDIGETLRNAGLTS